MTFCAYSSTSTFPNIVTWNLELVLKETYCPISAILMIALLFSCFHSKIIECFITPLFSPFKGEIFNPQRINGPATTPLPTATNSLYHQHGLLIYQFVH